MIDSTLMTSAPRQPSACGATGPAHHAVQSTTRMPSSGSRHGCRLPRAGPGRPVDVARCWPRWARPRRLDAAEIRYGTRGWHEPAGGARLEHAPLDEMLEPGDRRAVRARGRSGCVARPRRRGPQPSCALRGVVVHGARGTRRGAEPEVDPRHLRIVEPVRAADHHAEVLELLGAVGGEDDVAVGGRLDRRHLDRSTRTPPSGASPRNEANTRGERHHRDGDAVEHRHVDVLADAATSPPRARRPARPPRRRYP